jgi:hypothetical protein
VDAEPTDAEPRRRDYRRDAEPGEADPEPADAEPADAEPAGELVEAAEPFAAAARAFARSIAALSSASVMSGRSDS